ncbi:uncharacterized protein LOC131429397 [Malaya genurostris]|uniref:uncharacterized protein LOC131429397 n=1 Tax=Malaya genurostris TaxID=325434 RepID=UPI0026F3A69E|nr:uncharacterized protein LOC131429397 [Malaya genurostris]
MSSNVLQASYLGWLVAGPVGCATAINTVKVCQAAPSEVTDERLSELLKKFWTIDNQQDSLPDEHSDDCDVHFTRTHYRTPEGRYVVMIPFSDNLCELGESRKQALRRFHSLEIRLVRFPETKKMYVDFINEYLTLGHCCVVSDAEHKSESAYYLLHHCVMKPGSSSTKLRVVFDASAKSTTEISLNDVMMVGPTVQDPLFDIFLRFRMYRFAFTADISKMYRQVPVNPAQRHYQRILWRENTNEPIKELELNTVTYGMAAAPYLATRAIVQLANDERDNYPAASDVVLRSFYIDDLLAGADTLEEAKHLQAELTELLAKGGFELLKWCATDQALLENIKEHAIEKQLKFEDIDVDGVIKTLGILWDPINDVFMFRVKPVEENAMKPTKRLVLSETAKLFDLLGFLAPTVVSAKMLMQRLWKEKMNWDEPIPDDQLRIWSRLRSELCEISVLRIERGLKMDGATVFELHGFADASTIQLQAM